MSQDAAANAGALREEPNKNPDGATMIAPEILESLRGETMRSQRQYVDYLQPRAANRKGIASRDAAGTGHTHGTPHAHGTSSSYAEKILGEFSDATYAALIIGQLDAAVHKNKRPGMTVETDLLNPDAIGWAVQQTVDHANAGGRDDRYTNLMSALGLDANASYELPLPVIGTLAEKLQAVEIPRGMGA